MGATPMSDLAIVCMQMQLQMQTLNVNDSIEKTLYPKLANHKR